MSLPKWLPLVAVAVAVPRVAVPEQPSRCSLEAQAPSAARVTDCVSCHDRDAHARGGSHPVGIPYRRAQVPQAAARRLPLRAESEVVSRGLVLPDGKIECITCHDRRSPWRYHLALPMDAVPAPAHDPRAPGSADGGTGSGHAVTPPPRGAEVDETPLCLACHAIG